MKKFFEKNWAPFYFAFRVVIGILFLLHGVAKWGVVSSLDVTNLMFWAGLIEIVGGVFIAIGFMTQWAALISALQMLYAYVVVHAPNGLNPVGKEGNGGETALLFLVAFLVLLCHGAGKWAIDKYKGK